MKTQREQSSQYWLNALSTGGSTTIPRWTLKPISAVLEHEEKVSDALASALRALSDGGSMPIETVVLAAHAKVLAAMTGEANVTTGYLTSTSVEPLTCRLAVEPGSWRSLLSETHRRETELLSHAGFPVIDLERQLGLKERSFETVFDPTGSTGPLDESTVLSMGVSRDGDALALRMHYRSDALDADCARRIAGYHVTALALMAHDPDAEHSAPSLLSDEERHFQIEGLAGPRRGLPDKRFHELFEERAERQPDTVAGVCGDKQLTYRALNERANRIGRALLARGLEREGVVAVVTERNLDWMACVIAIFKAGGVYLPVEPHFPADRISRMLTRAECKLALSESGSDSSLDEAVEMHPQTQKILIADACAGGHAADNLGIEVTADQAAYIYFTSGSTGEPKGAMCEHAGMINHLLAKIEDFGIKEGEVVSEIAPQCFDISLWQLVSALLVGGRTHIIEQGTVLDVQRFVETIVNGKVSVMQVVPSYLEVVLSYLDEHPVELPDLHCVSVTGEAISHELVVRWFAAKPGIKLANAYGLTETSDDTNHEVMDQAPEGNQVPLGPCVRNVYVYLVDENLVPVPLGAPGEIVFSGVCVGRCYVNDPERTAKSFIADPIRKGERLYRSGDFGRWRPDGKLEFLGRQDAQVKIRGFRIEIGDIENALLRVDGLATGAVVVVERDNASKQLVAFYSGANRTSADVVRRALADALPEYMVPSVFHWQETLPLTANGKIDKKRLRVLALELDDRSGDFEAPVTPSEQKVAATWAKVLGVDVDTVGRLDNFFESGGTSLTVVKLVVGLERKVTLQEVIKHPVLADLAELLEAKTGRADADRAAAQPMHVQVGAGSSQR
jgi:amino acid adenylation domain-containing protein